MKKDRNCGMTPYPVYGQYQMPMMGPMMTPGMNFDTFQNTNDSQISQLQRQVTNLENRVSKLESSMNTISSTNYNATNFTNGNYHIV